MKKLSTSFMLIVLTVMLFAGCVPGKNSTSGEGSDPNGAVEVTIFTPKLSSVPDFSENEFCEV